MTNPIVQFGPTIRYMVVAIIVREGRPLSLDELAELLADEGWWPDMSRIADALLGELDSEIPLVKSVGNAYATVGMGWQEECAP